VIINNSQREKKSFKKYLVEIESPEYDGSDVSWGLPESPAPLEKAKYESCKKVLGVISKRTIYWLEIIIAKIKKSRTKLIK